MYFSTIIFPIMQQQQNTQKGLNVFISCHAKSSGNAIEHDMFLRNTKYFMKMLPKGSYILPNIWKTKTCVKHM